VVAVAFVLMWAGYGLADFGWCLFRDYDVTLGQLLSPVHPYAGTWPPPSIPAGQIWPGKASAASGSAAATSQQSAIPAVQGSAVSESEQAGSLLPQAIQQAFGRIFNG
jgi:hypothetical protein